MTAPAPLPMPANRRDYGPLAYVAAASAEARRVPPVLAALERVGLGLTHDWGADLEDALAEGLAANGGDRAACKRVALRCEAGATHADVFVLLEPPAGTETRGAWIEMGIARAQGVPIVYVGDVDSTVFATLADVVLPATATPAEIARAVADLLGLEIEDEEAREELRAQDRDEADFARTRGL